MAPLGNTRVIPAGWSEHHAPVAVGGMNGSCRIYDPATATTATDPETESTTMDRGAPVYDGPCRIEARLGERDVVQADDAESIRQYLVQLVMDAAPIGEGWELIPFGCINDARLNGAVLRVDDEELGTERFTRDLYATRVQ